MPEKIYGKFIEPKKGSNFFQISSDLNWLKKESSTKKNQQLKPDKLNDKSLLNFSQINEKIFEDFIAFYELIPLLVNISRSYPHMLIKEEVHKKFKNEGAEIKFRGRGNIYSLENSELPAINRSLRVQPKIKLSDFSGL